MAGKNPRFLEGPISYPVTTVTTNLVNGGVAGGQLVQIHAGTTTSPPEIEVAQAGTLTCIGVAENDAAPAGTDSATDLSARPAKATVHHGVVIAVTFNAASVAGDTLTVAGTGATAGRVTPVTVATQDPRTIVGRTFDGSVAAAAVGLAFIGPVGAVM